MRYCESDNTINILTLSRPLLHNTLKTLQYVWLLTRVRRSGLRQFVAEFRLPNGQMAGIKPTSWSWNAPTFNSRRSYRAHQLFCLYFPFVSWIHFIDTFPRANVGCLRSPASLISRSIFPRRCPAAFSITCVIWFGRSANKDICTINSPLYHSLPAKNPDVTHGPIGSSSLER